MKIAVDMDLFKTIHAMDKPPTAAELAQATGHDPDLIKRVMRELGAAQVFKEGGAGTYATTQMSRTMLDPLVSAFIGYVVEGSLPFFSSVPGYIRKNGFVAPSTDKLWKEAHNSDKTVYEFWDQSPERRDQFLGMMKVWSASQESWLDFYPTATLLSGLEEGKTVLVDVGGGDGRDIEDFRKRHPETSGKLILQDRQVKIDDATVGDGIEKMAHDFFTPQPVEGARAYFLHTVLHNHPDDKVKEILKSLRAAMRKDYSKILAYEETIRNEKPTELSCGMDLTMMAVFGTGSRAEAKWRDLFESVGLELVKTWAPSIGGQCLMEVVLRD